MSRTKHCGHVVVLGMRDPGPLKLADDSELFDDESDIFGLAVIAAARIGAEAGESPAAGVPATRGDRSREPMWPHPP